MIYDNDSNILKYEKFIIEKLGVQNTIDDIYKIVMDFFSKNIDKKYFNYSGEYLGKDINIDFFINPLTSELGYFKVIDAENNQYKISMRTFNKYTLIHELKHLDRFIRIGKNDFSVNSYIKYYSNIIGNSYPGLFKNRDLLLTIIYFLDQNEFESYYNHIYHEIKDILYNEPNSHRRKLIASNLAKKDIFIIYKYFYINKFNISDYFKSEEKCLFFLKELYKRLNNPNYYDSRISKMINKLKIFLGFINKENIDINNSNKKLTISKINKIVNNNVSKNYKKFYRLFTLLQS